MNLYENKQLLNKNPDCFEKRIILGENIPMWGGEIFEKNGPDHTWGVIYKKI